MIVIGVLFLILAVNENKQLEKLRKEANFSEMGATKKSKG